MVGMYGNVSIFWRIIEPLDSFVKGFFEVFFMEKKTVLAVDLGAESGRIMAAHFNGRTLELTPIHRFANKPMSLNGTLCWNHLELWREIQLGIEKARPYDPASIGVDAWGVDFGLLDKQGNLIGNLVQYRDDRTKGMMEKAFAKVGKEAIFSETGIQFSRINTLYQLLSMVESRSPWLEVADTFLTVPDLFHYFLSGTAVSEFSIATTTQMLNPQTREWAKDLLSSLGIPTHIFPRIVLPGTRLGQYQNIPVITPASHDTGSAVAAIPASTPNYAYICSGTWSLVGIEIDQPIINRAALEANATNEGGAYGTIRLLKNIMGLWLVQQCRTTWAQEGNLYNYSDLESLAMTAPPLVSFVNPNDSIFLPPGDHPKRIHKFCLETNQLPPQSEGETIRCILESLAMAYCDALQKILGVSGHQVQVIHMVGGGSKNDLLNQMTANATGIPVIAGPIEASAFGNSIVQLITLGELKNRQEARALILRMLLVRMYEPKETDEWAEAYYRYQKIVSR